MRIRWRGLELPNRVVCDRTGLTDTYGKFSAEPFERGFGVTVGNSLRRILLSSLEGSAVTRVKIQGVQHEITTIPGVVEDVPFVMDMTVENGRGYHTAEENAGKEREIGVIPVDSSFSPVVRVKYEIEDTRVGQKTNYDKLIMEIWTNGTNGPHLALVEGAKIMRKHLNPFIQYAEPGPEMALEERMDAAATGDQVDQELERKLNMSLAELELSVRATNCLESEGITTVRDLVIRTDEELLEVRNFGETTLREVKSKLSERGLYLGMKLPSSVRR